MSFSLSQKKIFWEGLSYFLSPTNLARCSAMAEKPRCSAGCVIVFAKSRRMELGDNILRTLVYLQFNHCDTTCLKICGIPWKTQNKGCYSVQGHSRSSRSVPIESPYAISY